MKRLLPFLLFLLNFGYAYSQIWGDTPTKPYRPEDQPKTFAIYSGVGYSYYFGEKYSGSNISTNFGFDYFLDSRELSMIGIRYISMNGHNDHPSLNIIGLHYRFPFKNLTVAAGPLYSINEEGNSFGAVATVGYLLDMNGVFFLEPGLSGIICSENILYPFLNIRLHI